jgi:hypothetical protein
MRIADGSQQRERAFKTPTDTAGQAREKLA